MEREKSIEVETRTTDVRLCELGNDIVMSRQELRDIAVEPLGYMRGLQIVQLEDITPAVATELSAKMTQTSLIEDLPRMHATLVDYLWKNMPHHVNHVSKHCEICSNASEYINLVHLAMDLNEPEVFKRIRAQLLLHVEGHQEYDRKQLFRHDIPHAEKHTTTPRSDKHQHQFDRWDTFDNLWKLVGDPVFGDAKWEDKEYDEFETTAIRNAREE